MVDSDRKFNHTENETTYLLLKGFCSIFLFGQSQQEVEADHLFQHCAFFPPCLADSITGFSVVRCNWDHKNQEWAFLSTSIVFIQYECVAVGICHKELCWRVSWWDLHMRFLYLISTGFFFYCELVYFQMLEMTKMDMMCSHKRQCKFDLLYLCKCVTAWLFEQCKV